MGFAHLPTDHAFLIDKKFDSAFWPWRRLLLECANYYACLAILWEACAAHAEEQKYFRALMVLSGRISWDIQSILLLLEKGYGPQAVAIGRTAIESLNCLALLSENPDLAEEFASVEATEDANKFWHKHLSKGKVRRFLKSWLDEKVPGLEHYDQDWFDGRLKLFGENIHPSYRTSSVPFQLLKDSDFDQLSYWSPGLTACARYDMHLAEPVFFSCFETSFILGTGRLSDGSPRRIEKVPENVLAAESGAFRYARNGHFLLTNMMLRVREYGDEEPLSNWRQTD